MTSPWRKLAVAMGVAGVVLIVIVVCVGLAARMGSQARSDINPTEQIPEGVRVQDYWQSDGHQIVWSCKVFTHDNSPGGASIAVACK